MRSLIAAVIVLATLPAAGLATGAAAGGATLDLPPTITIADRANIPPGATVRLIGYVLDSYLCPPCPPGATCKPCAGPSAIFVGAGAAHAPFSFFPPPADILVIATDKPGGYTAGVAYRFELTVADARSDAFDGRLLRAEPADEPEWTDNPDRREQPGVVPVK